MVRHLFILVVAGLLAVGCGQAVTVVRVDDVPAGDECAAGGVVIHTGGDDNENGSLENGEIDASELVCNGEDGNDGVSTLIETSDELPGTNCTYGGLVIRTGTDDDDDGVLDAEEVDATSYLCEYRASLVRTAAEAPGSNCSAGGLSIETGIDIDGDGVLDDAEVMSTAFVCGGADAERVAIRADAEPAGLNCANGGLAVHTGIDDDEDGALENSEIDLTAYVCNGGDGTNSLVDATLEPAGPNCVAGGILLRTGVDADGDDILDASEMTSSNFVCNGAASVPARYAARLLDPVPTTNRQFGEFVTMHGDLLIVGAATIGGAAHPVFVFARDAGSGNWSYRQTITAPYAGDNAGERAAGFGNVIAITARNNGQEASNRGAVYVYERNIGTGVWEPFQTLLPADSSILNFGTEVTVGDGVIAITSSGTKLFVFTKNTTTGVWEKTQTLTPPSASYLKAVAISASTLAVGVGTASSPGSTVHVYELVSATGLWTHSQAVTPILVCCPQESLSPEYGQYLALEGGRLAVGEPGDDEYGANAGIVYVFDRVVGTGWVQRGEVAPTDAGDGFSFGTAVALSGDLLIASGNSDEFGGNSGGAYVFEYDGDAGWVETQRLISPDKQAEERFGFYHGLTASGGELVVAAQGHDHFATTDAGAVHSYDLQ